MIEYVVIFLLIWLVLGALFVLRAVISDYTQKIDKRRRQNPDFDA
jgi:hypothetical protein